MLDKCANFIKLKMTAQKLRPGEPGKIEGKTKKKENLTMTDIREYLTHKPLLFDGGMGTYYKAAPGVECELANLHRP